MNIRLKLNAIELAPNVGRKNITQPTIHSTLLLIVTRLYQGKEVLYLIIRGNRCKHKRSLRFVMRNHVTLILQTLKTKWRMSR